MQQALAARLDDTANVYFSVPENKLYLVEALREWQSMTRYWRDTFSFNPAAQAPPVNAFIDITQQPGTLVPFTVKDSDLVSEMCYNLIEPQLNAGLWAGTTQFTLYDLTQALQRRRDQFLVETGMVLTRSFINTPAPPISQVPLADNVIDVRRAAWFDATSRNWSVVWKQDEYRAQSLRFNWYTSPGIPVG